MTGKALSRLRVPLVLLVSLAFVSCAGLGSDDPETLRLATTTSTEDSGLLSEILPDFEDEYDAEMDVIAVGTGQALELGERGDVDVLLVHAPEREIAFVEAGSGINRQQVMFNDFVIVGPEADPAGIASAESAAEAFEMISSSEKPFTSRGDDSGTHTKERSIWGAAGVSPESGTGWYSSLGQGMGETLITANEMQAYALTDRATYLSMGDEIAGLVILFGGRSIAENPDEQLYNPYGVIQVNPERHDGINDDLAAQFVEWITSSEIQAAIGEFGRDEFGQPLFQPMAGQ